MRYSATGDRTGSVPLAGSSIVRGTGIYAFFSETEPFVRVEFWLDDPTGTGTPRARELTAPYDFAGGTVAVANVFDTGALAVGNHSIRVVATRADGSTDANRRPNAALSRCRSWWRMNAASAALILSKSPSS